MPQGTYMDVVSGRRRGLGASLLRALLVPPSMAYALLLRVRNWYYDKLAMPHWLQAPVISVGNLTVGGTGKTPMTIWVCERLQERGRKPAVLSRGYKAAQGVADELLLVSRRCPKAVAIAHSDRRAAGELAVSEYAATAAVLDDGFQHRRLGRDLDILLIDATRPFGYEWVLPRGLLRESLRGLRRAEAVVMTRCDQVDPAELAAIDARIRSLAPEVPVVHAVHEPTGFADLQGNPAAAPHGRIGAFAGIARPEAFARTLETAGVQVVDVEWWPDHHAYSSEDAAFLADWVRSARLDALVTTEKDAVKLGTLEVQWPAPVSVLGVQIALLGDGEAVLTRLIDEMLRDHEEPGDTEVPADE